MVTRPRTGFLVAALATAALGGYLWWKAREEPPPAVAAAARDRRGDRGPIPRIALDRLDRQAEQATPGPSRDIFTFGRPEPTPATPPPAAGSQATAGPPATPAPVAAPAAPAGPPPFGVRYLGTVERQGLRLAVLLSEDKKEILTGREGDTVANRLKIVKIGLESVEVRDLGSERVRRIPLKGN